MTMPRSERSIMSARVTTLPSDARPRPWPPEKAQTPPRAPALGAPSGAPRESHSIAPHRRQHQPPPARGPAATTIHPGALMGLGPTASHVLTKPPS